MSEEIESRDVDQWISELEKLSSEQRVSPSIKLRALLDTLTSEAPEEALQFLEKKGEGGIGEIPEFPSLVAKLARSLISAKKIDLAERLLRLLRSWKLSLDQDTSLLVARALMDGGRLGGAKALLLSFLESRKADVLRQLYQIATLEGDLPGANELLIDLVETDPTLPTATFAHRERKKLPSPAGGKHVKIAILSSYVLDNLALFLEHESRSVGIDVDIYIAPFNQYTQEILNPSSGLHKFQPDITVIAVAIEDLFPGVEGYPSKDELSVARDEIRESVRTLASELHEKTNTLVVLHDFTLMHKSPHGILDTKSPTGLVRWVEELNHQLAEDLRVQERTFLLPLNQLVGWVGKARAGSPKMRYLASMRFADAMLPALAKYTMRYVKPLTGLTRKCVVLDLDGTLWGGIVGELGPEGIQLGPTAPGREFLDFQKALLNLSQRGVLIALCSKNNPEDISEVFESNRYMLLREEHISATRINWKNKVENIREIARELNIGLDSIVFMDDNPNERELVRQLLPEVLTVEMPRDPSLYRSTLEDLADFESFAITTEDTQRREQYRARENRETLKQGSASLEDFYASLNIQVEIRTNHRSELQRLGQMFMKTNQFNLTTKRYLAAEIEEFMNSESHRVYSLVATDRFGDHGTVAAAIIRHEDKSWRIDSFLMSCRVIGYSIEQTFLSRIHQDARSARVKTIVGEFIPTEKNQPSKDFYSRHGFKLSSERNGVESWSMEVSDFKIESPIWVQTV